MRVTHFPQANGITQKDKSQQILKILRGPTEFSDISRLHTNTGYRHYVSRPAPS